MAATRNQYVVPLTIGLGDTLLLGAVADHTPVKVGRIGRTFDREDAGTTGAYPTDLRAARKSPASSLGNPCKSVGAGSSPIWAGADYAD